jgi:HK97 family phage portal protein
MALFDFLKRKVQNTINSSLKTIAIGNSEVFVHIDTDKAIEQGYNGNTAVYSIINKDAKKFASVPSYLYKANSEDGETIENDLSKLLGRPNDYQGADAFRELVRTYYKLTGEVFIWLNRGALADDSYDEYGNLVPIPTEKRVKMPVLEMTVLPSNHVILIPDPNNIWGCIGYKLEVNGQRINIPKEDIIHWKNVSLKFDAGTREHLRGFSPLSAGFKTLQQNNDATAASVRMYQNDGAKGLLFNEGLNTLTPTQREQITNVVDRKINSNDVKGAVATLQGKWGYLDLGKNNTDLGLLEGKNISMKELCFLFDVPYEFFDSETTFANKEQAQKGWIYNSIMPSCKQFDDELNRVLLIAFGLENVAVIRSDFDDLPEMREDVAQLVTSLQAAWWITPNEKREWMGFDPYGTEFDEPFIPGGTQPLSMAGVSMDQVANDLANQGLND